ncbi:MAG: hypothetical protein Q9187_000689 [Circinaria calcarea]
MQLTTVFLPLLVSTLAAARFLGSQTRLTDDLPVPGDNPLHYCQSPTDNILAIDYVDLSPNPPSPGKKLTIEASGTFSEKIEKGAYVVLTVKYGLITLVHQMEDLCEQLQNVDKKCPIGPGSVKITKDVDIPAQIPPGKYTTTADVYTGVKTKDGKDKKITCLTATVTFAVGR